MFRKRIHIVPVGYELDRVVLPVTGVCTDEIKADIVYLITKSKKDKAKLYVDEIKKRLNNVVRCKVEFCNDIKDIYEILRVMRKIIIEERNNDIYINVSSGSTMSTIAGVMAAMLFKEEDIAITPYYVDPKKYGDAEHELKLDPITKGVQKIVAIPNYKAHLPNLECIGVMKFISGRGDAGVRKKELVDYLYPKHAKKEREKTEKSIQYMYVTRHFIEPLRNTWKLLRVEGNGRNGIIKLTKNGQDMIRFLKD